MNKPEKFHTQARITRDLDTGAMIISAAPNERGVVTQSPVDYTGEVPNRKPDFKSEYTSQVDGQRTRIVGWFV
jgi:hypothetical protein